MSSWRTTNRVREGCVLNVAISPNGRYICTTDDCNQLLLSNLETGDIIWRSNISSKDTLHEAIFSPDGQIVAASSGCETNLWAVDSGELIHTMDEGGYLCFNHDGTHLLINNDCIFDLLNENITHAVLHILSISSLNVTKQLQFEWIGSRLHSAQWVHNQTLLLLTHIDHIEYDESDDYRNDTYTSQIWHWFPLAEMPKKNLICEFDHETIARVQHDDNKNRSMIIGCHQTYIWTSLLCAERALLYTIPLESDFFTCMPKTNLICFRV